MPFLREKLDSYHAFATATLGEIYTESRLNYAQQLKVTMTDSGTLINDGDGQFEFRPLPWLAQTSPGFGIQFLHVNDDFYPDLFIAQNFNSLQRETGRMNGGVSMLLTGNEQGNFTPRLARNERDRHSGRCGGSGGNRSERRWTRRFGCLAE